MLPVVVTMVHYVFSVNLVLLELPLMRYTVVLLLPKRTTVEFLFSHIFVEISHIDCGNDYDSSILHRSIEMCLTLTQKK